MAKWRTRICPQCGREDFTASSSLICQDCFKANKKLELIEIEKSKLQELGYEIISGPVYNKFGKREYTLKRTSCGHNYTARYDNIISSVNDNGFTPCSECGAKLRMDKCLTGFIDKYGRDYSTFDRSKFEDYQLLVRIKSDDVFEKNKVFFTKNGLIKRGKTDHHLDHIVPIKACFDNGITVETASSKINLSLVPYLDNLKKSWSKYSSDDLNVLLEIDRAPKNKNTYSQLSAHISHQLLANGIRAKQRKKQFIEFDNSPVKLKILKDNESQTDIEQQTFYIRESEITNKNDLVISRIMQLIGKSKRLFARKCFVTEIDTKSYSSFCKAHHIQDSAAAKVKLGLFDKESSELVSVLSFSKPRFTDKYDFELLRFCNKTGLTVVGGASKLFKHFLSMYPGARIVSYADKRWSRGNVYRKMGFTLVSETANSFYYFKNGVIISRYQAQKHRLRDLLEEFDNECTEVENMTRSGYIKVLNPGQYVFEHKS